VVIHEPNGTACHPASQDHDDCGRTTGTSNPGADRGVTGDWPPAGGTTGAGYPGQYGPDDLEDRRRGPCHLGRLHGHRRDLRHGQDVRHHRADRSRRRHCCVAAGQAVPPELAAVTTRRRRHAGVI